MIRILRKAACAIKREVLEVRLARRRRARLYQQIDDIWREVFKSVEADLPEMAQDECIASAALLRRSPEKFAEVLAAFRWTSGQDPQAVIVQNHAALVAMAGLMLKRSDLRMDIDILIDPQIDPDEVRFVARAPEDELESYHVR